MVTRLTAPLAGRDRHVGCHRLGPHHGPRRRVRATLLDRHDRTEPDTRGGGVALGLGERIGDGGIARLAEHLLGIGKIELRPSMLLAPAPTRASRVAPRRSMSRTRALTWFDTW